MFETWLGGLLIEFSKLVGVGLLVTALVGVGKKLGWIPDGSADKAAKVLNLVLFVVFVVFVGLVGLVVPPWVDGLAGLIAQLILALLGILTQFKVSSFGYQFAKAHAIPIAGYSHNDVGGAG